MAAALEPGWLNVLSDELEKPYMKELKSFLLQEKQKGFVVYPKGADIFNAFNHTPFDKVKVVILGQDPYHGQGQAHGLSFSVQKGIAVPPSLKNMYKELAEEFPDFKTPSHGDLTTWADQGVLLLNATLTVRANEAGSHQKRGWEIFTDHVISQLSAKKTGLVFLLWGKFAQQKESLIDTSKHFVLKAAHPSPFSAYNGFFGSNHFKKTNEILEKEGLEPINWQIDPNP
ncbi:uracil-DNA glycosylase [Pedobacter frigiditerrae]|uniref:Uracil-DNA glycosylase n=1 Tax=Pedobacter frigiditerrae TaxID=2530452 RepID=A0A4R0MT64_9SPHI|nr:uracil-DNA glycosylase [Pedobacter frigiditerrae]TCC89124.1 uracil-DNA glycosylase [Pedobacter frigiditerrae]